MRARRRASPRRARRAAAHRSPVAGTRRSGRRGSRSSRDTRRPSGARSSASFCRAACVRRPLHRNGTLRTMSTAEILGLGAIAGLTIYIGLPLARVRGVSPAVKTFFAATATGILIFLLWDVLTAAVDPVEAALTAGRDGRFAWYAF